MAEPYLRGIALWPGLESRDIECTYTVSHGASPGRASLVAPPEQLAGVAETGDLVLSDGRQTVTLADCHVAEPRYVGGGGQAPTMTLTIEDHRWRWRFGSIGGRYNIVQERFFPIPPVSQWELPQGNAPLPPPREPRGEEPIREDTRKSAQELARLLLDAMGEADYDVSALDANAFPSVNWDAALPAQALTQLCEDQGCRLVWQPVQNRVLVAKAGEGQDLPDGPLQSDAPGFEVKARPAKLGLYGHRTQWEVMFKVRAVAQDFDGKLVEIDDLSYRPKNGWVGSWPPWFDNLPIGERDLELFPGTPGDVLLPPGKTREDARALAREWVYRAYQVFAEDPYDDTKPLVIPPDKGGAKRRGGPGEITDVRQVRILPERNTVDDDERAEPVLYAATCYGRHSPPPGRAFKVGETIVSAYEQTDVDTEVKVPFSVDPDHNLIVFAQPVFAWKKDEGKIYPAEITLLTACEAYDAETFQYFRYYRELPVRDGLDAKPATIVREEVRYQETARYGGGKLLEVRTNETFVRGRADYHLVGESLRYLADEVGQRTYAGLLPLDPDGKVQQVTWAVGGGQKTRPSTTASTNGEHQLYLPSYRERRQVEETSLDALRRQRDDQGSVSGSAAGGVGTVSPGEAG